jgi:hypothetical protein
MNYELFTYHQIFEQTINNNQKTTTNIEELKTDLKLESKRILTAIQNNIGNQDPSRAVQYIYQHQQAIHIILEDLEKLENTEESNIIDNKNQIITILRAASENLLMQLQKYFPSHFNHHSKIPSNLLKKTKEDIEQKTAHLIKVLNHLKTQKQQTNTLKDALHPILTEHRAITYYQKAYMESFLEKLTAKLEQAENGKGTMDILIHIISSNYNHPLFYNFCCQYFTQEIERCEELSAQYSTLNFIKKCIKQTYSPTQDKYSPDQPSIQDSLNKYIRSELEYLESMDKIGAHLHQHGLLDERYKVTLTVKQLAIFIHLQVEANIIIAETPKLLHEYIAKHYSTNETDRISAKSFKNAYYSASTEDLEKVIDKIVTMLAIAQEKL